MAGSGGEQHDNDEDVPMDWQTAFDIALGVVMLLLGWILRVVWDAQVETRRSLAELERQLPATYARRDDMHALGERLDARFDRLEDLLRGRSS